MAAGLADADAVLLREMTKTYKGGKRAVRGVSLGIPNGECFGLLGINGAGKVILVGWVICFNWAGCLDASVGLTDSLPHTYTYTQTQTTTLSILTAEFPPSSGTVRLGGYDIADNPDVVRRLVGYCPQVRLLLCCVLVDTCVCLPL